MKRFAVIGHPVAHSLSPVMHKANFEAVGYDGEYGKFDVDEHALADFVRARRDEGYLGLNVTVPHKIAVMDILGRVDGSVAKYGACNTLKFERDGTISGYNTDVDGFIGCLVAHGFSLSGKRVAILGCGGAGSALANACVREGAISVYVASRTPASRSRLCDALRNLQIPGCEIGEFPPSEIEIARAADLIVNATPVGLKEGDASAIPCDAFRPGQIVLDIIPTRRLPPTAAAARRAGATGIGGLEFLVEQGARSFEIWTGLAADRSAMLRALV